MKQIIAFLLSGSAILLAYTNAPPASAQQVASPPPSGSVVYLDQGWSEADRQWFDHFSQGSAVLDYRLFLNLEAADSEQLFRSTLDDPRYGLILDAASPQNPDGLPIGITRSPVAKPIRGWPVGDYVGVTCAACHNGELIFKGRRVRIQGGNSRTVDLQGLVHGLDSALSATLQDPTKFKRLVARLGASTADAQASLKSMIEAEKFRVHSYATRTSATPHAWGPGRMDALSMILDRSTGTLTGVEQNWSPGIAPVKPPFLWNAPHGTWAQWAAVAQDPFNRNLTESIGVFLPVDLQSGTPAEGLFQSNASVIDLNRAEKQLQRLAPPSWPEDIFGKIDREKARAGKALFTELCAGCHNAWPYRWTEPNKFGKRFVIVGLIPQTEVGTDATQAKALNTFAITGDVAKYLPKQFQGSQVLSKDTFNNLLANLVRETALRKLNLSEAQEVDLAGYRELPPPPAPAGVYKAAPRDGVWATAPFLHNGSVPNLYEMLIPAAQRSKTFYLGSDFDPIKVGLDTSAKAGTFLMDTETPGNSNAGHSFQDGVRGAGVVGPLLTENQRWALIEYLKSIPEQPGRITPFGGPAQDQVPQK